MLSLQRQVGVNTLLGVSYVGNQAHHLLVLEAANPGNPALCLSLSQPSEVDRFRHLRTLRGKHRVHHRRRATINGTRGPFGPAFGSVSYQAAIGNSNFNALEASLRHTSGGTQLLVSYTWSKSIDQASNLGDQVDPFNPSLEPGTFLLRHAAEFCCELHLQAAFRTLFHAATT